MRLLAASDDVPVMLIAPESEVIVDVSSFTPVRYALSNVKPGLVPRIVTAPEVVVMLELGCMVTPAGQVAVPPVPGV